MSVLEGMKINRMLKLNMRTLKGCIEMIIRLLRVEKLYRKIKKVKKTLKSSAMNGLR